MGVLSPSNHSVDRSLPVTCGMSIKTFYRLGISIALVSHSLDLFVQLIAPTSGFGRFTCSDSMTSEAIVVQM